MWANSLLRREKVHYVPEDTGNSGESSSAENQRTKLKEFLSACNTGSTVGCTRKNGKTQVCVLEEFAYQKSKNQL